MPVKDTGSIIQIAQKLVNRLPEEMDNRLKGLIRRARLEDAAAVESEIIDLLYPHENIRRWMKEQISSQTDDSGGTRGLGYATLAGDPSVPASQKWICPDDRCSESLPVIQEDEDPPTCSIHNRVMKRAERKKG